MSVLVAERSGPAAAGDRGPSTALRTTDDLCRVIGARLSDQQLTAVTAPLVPGRVVAGAGTGKTTVMAARVVWLVATGQVAPDQVLGLTFTTRAAAELSRRISTYLARAGLGRSGADDTGEPTVSTYHAYAGRLLVEHGLRIGFESDTRVLADATRFQLAAAAIRRFSGPVDHLTDWLPTAVGHMLALDAELSEHLVSPDDVRRFQRRELAGWAAAKQTKAVREVVSTLAARGELLELVELYRRIKADRAVMDFADQMGFAARLAESRPEVGAAERSRFAVVLLDEYQDTSVAQARLLGALFSDCVDQAGAGFPVTAVGDPCQAIYGWRGASVGNIEHFSDYFPQAGRASDRDGGSARPAASYPLTLNRRSGRRILAAANAIAEPLYDAFPGASPLRAVGGAAEAEVRLALLETYRDELDFVVGEVRGAAGEGTPWSQIAVLSRDNRGVAAVNDALVAADIPVEVVGLGGLLRLPEVVEVVSTLQVLQDPTANPALLTLLTGPRWAVGPRDLALLGQRARRLAADGRADEDGSAAGSDDVRRRLADAVAGTDPADLMSLAEALDDPGPLPYSTAARRRFAALSRELADLRRYVGEPLLDLARRVVDVSGLEVELASSSSPVAAARRRNLATFLDAVATFAGSGAEATLDGLLAFLRAEDEFGQGLTATSPSPAESVKLLTVHRAKGLEWDVVIVPAMCAGVFPPGRSPSRWTSCPSVLPTPLRGDAADLPAVRERSPVGLTTYVAECRAAALAEERRLVYVALTRPRRRLVVSAHWWGPEQVRPRGPSVFFKELRAAVEADAGAVEPEAPAPADGAANPVTRMHEPVAWPAAVPPAALRARTETAALVRAASDDRWRAAADAVLEPSERAQVAQWDLELSALLEEARSSASTEVVVELPGALSASTLLRLASDPQALARDLARPMPRKPSPAARFGTRFHAWVAESAGQAPLLESDDLPDRADLQIAGDAELAELIEAFRRGPFGQRVPLQVEAPFSLVLAGHVLRGRIDAVYATDSGFQVVDWKTSRQQQADPLQLAIYRLAWAELVGVPIESVSACFCYVRTGEVTSYDDLPGRADLERIVGGS